MSSVEMNGRISVRELDVVATRLVKKGLYVTTEINGRMQKYIPNDAEARSEMVKLAIQKGRGIMFGRDPTLCLLAYSNNPNRIREINFSY